MTLTGDKVRLVEMPIPHALYELGGAESDTEVSGIISCGG